jgi:type II secretory pathway pseudopilin PulG
MRLKLSSSLTRGYTLVELICIMAVVLILAFMLTPRIMQFRKVSARARNVTNVRTLEIALLRAQVEGKSFTDAASVESLVAQLVNWRLIYDSPTLTSVQITMIDDGSGVLEFYPTYDP